MSILEFASYSAPFSPSVDPRPSVAADDFKFAMRHLSGAVSVVTTGYGAERTGFTATSVSSFSVEPPTVLVSLNRTSSSWAVLQRTGAFAVNILTAEQSHIADRFAGRGGEKGVGRYVDGEWRELATGVQTLVGALTVIDCELDEVIERHSHALLIGRVRAIEVQGQSAPLLYYHGSYGRFDRTPR
ncbi:flavin reductase family protein [Devosia sp. 2618]|uniref:flavin reductase family protein n=1 Tax=Devosia sp. 2618 TaxID=3156454 RepID=UPI0033974B75